MNLTDLNATNLTAAFTAYRADMAASYCQRMQYALDQLTSYFGPTVEDVRRAANCHRNIGLWHSVRSLLFHPTGVTSARALRMRPAELCADKLQAAADKYADALVTELVAKVMEKVGDLQDARLVFASGCRFVLVGKRGSDDVRIEQDQILNVSKRGKLFNQWPARISLNGKRISATAYAKLPAPVQRPAVVQVGGEYSADVLATMTRRQLLVVGTEAALEALAAR